MHCELFEISRIRGCWYRLRVIQDVEVHVIGPFAPPTRIHEVDLYLPLVLQSVSELFQSLLDQQSLALRSKILAIVTAAILIEGVESWTFAFLFRKIAWVAGQEYFLIH